MKSNEPRNKPGPKELSVRQKIQSALFPFRLDIINESHKHRGHQGYADESHFHITIGSEAFEGKTTLACHRMIFDTLKDEMVQDQPGSIHALSLKIIRHTPLR